MRSLSGRQEFKTVMLSLYVSAKIWVSGFWTTMTVIDMGVPRVISKALTTEQGAVLKKSGSGGRLPGEGYGLSAREETCL